MLTPRAAAAAMCTLLAVIHIVAAGCPALAAVGNTLTTVSIASTPTAEPTDAQIEAATRQAVALAGGLPAGIGPGKKIIIHPNLVEAGWASGTGVVTHKTVIRTVIRMCIEMGASPADITICEGTAAFNTSGMGGFPPRSQTWKAYKDTGLNLNGDVYEDETGARLMDANDVGATYPTFPAYSGPYDSSYVTIIQNPNFWINRVYALPNAVVYCDYLIRIPVLKSHNLAGVTGALKLAFGHAAADIYHLSGSLYYKWNMLHQNAWGDDELTTNAKGMADMTMARPPDFIVMDALVGITNGPTGEQGYALTPPGGKMRSILASRDPVAIDTIEALSCTYKADYGSVPGLVTSAVKGLGTMNPGLIHVRGNHVTDIRRLFQIWGSADRGNAVAPSLSSINVSLNPTTGLLTVTPVGASDSDPGLAKAELSVDGVVVTSTNAPGYIAACLMKGASRGSHDIRYTLYDGMLNEVSKTATVNIDLGEPIPSTQTLANGTPVFLGPVVFTGTTKCIDSSTFFVASEDGAHGLRVRMNGAAPTIAEGSRISLSGKLSSISGQRVLLADDYKVVSAGAPARPLFMQNWLVGGHDLNSYTKGVADAPWGPYNLGCLVRTSGRVLSTGPGYFIISDGSRQNGLKVLCGSIAVPETGKLAVVTGAACVDDSGGLASPFVAVRQASDIQIY